MSRVSHVLLQSLPWPLVPHTETPSPSALNGQCWVVDSAVYHAHEPHLQVKDAVLEDVAMGRHLKRQGHPPALLDVQDLVAVHMYDDLAEAWRGFRKNAYLLLGGTPTHFFLIYAGLVSIWLVAPLLSIWFLASLYGLKLVPDRASGTPLHVSALVPVSYVLGLALLLDSALHHWIDRVTWKGRSVSTTDPHSARPTEDSST